ncbi:MAG: multiheme c-type cytochrome [Myxococcota bacterium]
MSAVAAAQSPLEPSSTSAATERAGYLGSEACRNCHAAAYAVWQSSAHARADRALGEAPSPVCLACHSTGAAPVAPTASGGVGCEACHGPGAGYAADDVMRNPQLSRLLGLRELSTPAARAALCASCHRDHTRLVPFDVAAAMGRIDHWSRPERGRAEAPADEYRPAEGEGR